MSRTRRRTVRIVKRRSALRGALLSVFVAFCAAVALFLVWRFWQSEDAGPARQRGLSDVTLTWRCESGHTFRGPGQLDPVPCHICRKLAYPSDMYECDIHGAISVMVRLGVNEEGEIRPQDYRIGPGAWKSIEAGISCTRCPRKLTRQRKDPFSIAPRRRR